MDYKKLREFWLEEESAYFQGWNFSNLCGRMEGGKIPWDYFTIINNYLNNMHTLLDMGTGGGEFLLSLGHPHNQTYITEAYPSNVELCRKTLTPLGICVKQVFDDSQLPYNDEMFDIVINRHGAFDAKEVNRVLRPNGIFITQQVGGENDNELRTLLNSGETNSFSKHTLENNISVLNKANFEILLQDECFSKSYFFDVGAIVYFAKIIEWEFPDFSVQNYFQQLCMLHEKISQIGFIENTEHRFIIIAQKFV